MYSPTRTGRSNEASEEEELYIQEREMHGARLHGAFARPLPRVYRCWCRSLSQHAPGTGCSNQWVLACHSLWPGSQTDMIALHGIVYVQTSIYTQSDPDSFSFECWVLIVKT
jgi:hypothetical protein